MTGGVIGLVRMPTTVLAKSENVGGRAHARLHFKLVPSGMEK